MPTGFLLPPPFGPAKPVVARPMCVLARDFTLLAIRMAVFSDTALKRPILILSIFDFALLEYNTRPNLKYFELPLIFVRA